MKKYSDVKPKVLYVDDIQANLVLFEASFNDHFDVLLAESAKQALEILEKEDVHVVVSDQNMPGMTGNELLEIVTREYPDLMRFMITAYTDYDTVVDAINKGNLYGYFNKPYNVDEVKHAIERSLEVRSLRIKNREMIEKLERANELLVGLDRSKTNFLGSITDEIRTPINKIMTAVHMIKDKIDSKELSELLYMLDVSVRRLENFSEVARQLVRLNEAGFKPEMAPVSLRELMEVSIIETGSLFNQEEVSLELKDLISDQEVEGEYELLLLTLTSLMGYIVGHIHGITRIKIGLNDRKENISLEVHVDGDFNRESERDTLMKYRNIEAEEGEDDSSIEIVLVKEIMRIHGGDFIFSSNSEENVFAMQFSGN